jgi:CubicO group peptidase (beta-lactamase class C family)
MAPPGTTFRYGDVNFIILGEIVQRVGGSRLNEFVQRELFRPLKMNDTGFLPAPALVKRIAPTEVVDEEVLRGKVHDPTAQRMDGVAGHAGLFTTAADLARFCRMLLNDGELDGVRVFAPETVQLMTSAQTPAQIPERRGLGWDIDSPYSSPRGQLFPIGSYGQTGWTGTSIWIDPFSRTFLILLSNRNHPSEAGNVTTLRSRLGTLAAEAVTGFDFGNVPGALPRRTVEQKSKVDP